jgi:heat shock protein HtpX
MREWHFILALLSTVAVIAYVAYAIPYIRNKKIFIQRDFIGTNLAILVVLIIAMRLLGLDTVLAQQGAGSLNLTGFLIIAGIIGMSGSFISLAMSKWMAKRMTGAQV